MVVSFLVIAPFSSIDKIAKTYIGSKKIDEITSKELQDYMNSQKHLSNSSISKLFGQFNQVFKIAMNKGYIMKNPMIEVLKPRSNKKDKKVRAMTLEEQQQLTDYLLNSNLAGSLVKVVAYSNSSMFSCLASLSAKDAISSSDLPITS